MNALLPLKKEGMFMGKPKVFISHITEDAELAK